VRVAKVLPAEVWATFLVLAFVASCASVGPEGPPLGELAPGQIRVTILADTVERRTSIQGDVYYNFSIEYQEPGGAMVHFQMKGIDTRHFMFFSSREMCLVREEGRLGIAPCR
jgi:hypothetical protein